MAAAMLMALNFYQTRQSQRSCFCYLDSWFPLNSITALCLTAIRFKLKKKSLVYNNLRRKFE